jgi:hypothetical protein
MRFLFDTNTSVTTGTTYHIVYQGDYTASDTNYTTWWGTIAAGYASGSSKEFRGAWGSTLPTSGVQDLWFKTFVKSTPITSVTMPAGYDQRCLISYVYNDSNSKFKQYVQKNRSMVMSVSSDWKAFTSITGLIEAVNLGASVPPITCSVQFYHWLTNGSPRTHVPIGGVASTDMPIVEVAASGTAGSVSANSRGLDVPVANPSLHPYGVLIVEEQVILARMQNTGCFLYTTSVLF